MKKNEVVQDCYFSHFRSVIQITWPNQAEYCKIDISLDFKDEKAKNFAVSMWFPVPYPLIRSGGLNKTERPGCLHNLREILELSLDHPKAGYMALALGDSC